MLWINSWTNNRKPDKNQTPDRLNLVEKLGWFYVPFRILVVRYVIDNIDKLIFINCPTNQDRTQLGSCLNARTANLKLVSFDSLTIASNLNFLIFLIFYFIFFLFFWPTVNDTRHVHIQTRMRRIWIDAEIPNNLFCVINSFANCAKD